MQIKKFLFPLFAIWAGQALVRRLVAEPSLAQKAVKHTSFEAIDDYLEVQLKRLNIPGASLAIVEDERIVHLRGFGRARPGGEAPTPQTSFFIGSTTKSFTAMAVMQLVEAGRIELDAPVQRYLTWFRVADPQASAQMTVRQLLNQTSGLPLLPSWQLLADFDERPEAAERQARVLASLKLTRSVGSAFEYSNLNYNLLGLIIEAVSGEPYAAYIQKHIFDPLEMRHSFADRRAAKRDDLAAGHLSWFGVPVPAPDLPAPVVSLPSGQLISSAEDMAHYLIAYLNGGRFGKAQILSPEGIAELHRPAVDATSIGDPEQYAMGWYIGQQGQIRVVSHTGMIPDFYTYMALLPEQKKGVILLVNTNHFTMQLTMLEVGRGLTALMAGSAPPPIQFGAIPWVQRCLPLILLVQLAGAVATLRQISRWRHNPALLPDRRRLLGHHILLPLIPNSLAALTLIPVLGKLGGFLMLFMPDASWLALISGGFGLVWGALRTLLVCGLLRRSSVPQA